MAWSYEEAEAHVLGLEQFGMRFGLERIRALLARLGDPQDAFESIHVVGSNGKSSTVRFAAAILGRHGISAGAYLSPHLRGFNERVLIGDSDSGRDAFAAAVQRTAVAASAIERGRSADDLVTQFETLTAAAFLLLAEAGVEVAVAEAGLGGRHDATNVLRRSCVQVLTNVALEHTQWLGSTVTEIAGEKLAVVNERATLVVGAGTHPDALTVARRVCAQRAATLIEAPADPGVAVAARGAYQRRNFALARAAVAAQLGALDVDAIAAAAASVAVPGRFELRDAGDGGALVVLDGAHNAHAAAELARALSETFPGQRAVGVVSVLADKDAAQLLRALAPALERIVCTRCSNPRALDPGELLALARELGIAGEVVQEPHAALGRARELAGAGGIAVATGSLYLLADLERPAGTGSFSTL